MPLSVRIPRLRHLRNALTQIGTSRRRRLNRWLDVVSADFANSAQRAFTVDSVNDELDIAAHGLSDGDGPFTVSTTDTLPAGILANTLYWVAAVTPNTLSIHRTHQDALAGSNAVDITDSGVGTHSLIASASNQSIIEHLRQGEEARTVTLAGDVDSVVGSKYATNLHIIASEIADVNRATNVFLIGDSLSAPLTSPRIAQGIMKEFQWDWRKRILWASVAAAPDEGWNSFSVPTDSADVGEALPDGTIVPQPFNCQFRHYATEPASFSAWTRTAFADLDEYFGGDWTLNEPMTWQHAVIKVGADNNADGRAIYRRGGVSVQTINFELEDDPTLPGNYYIFELNFDASTQTGTTLESFLDTGTGNEITDIYAYGAHAIGITGKTNGVSLTINAFGGHTTRDLIFSDSGGDEVASTVMKQRFDLFDEWPTQIWIMIGQNSASGEFGGSTSGRATYKSNLEQIIAAYDALYTTEGRPLPKYLLIGNWQTSKTFFRELIEEQIQTARETPGRIAHVNLYDLINDEFGEFATWSPTLLADGIHQSVTGTETFMNRMWVQLSTFF